MCAHAWACFANLILWILFHCTLSPLQIKYNNLEQENLGNLYISANNPSLWQSGGTPKCSPLQLSLILVSTYGWHTRRYKGRHHVVKDHNNVGPNPVTQWEVTHPQLCLWHLPFPIISPDRVDRMFCFGGGSSFFPSLLPVLSGDWSCHQTPCSKKLIKSHEGCRGFIVPSPRFRKGTQEPKEMRQKFPGISEKVWIYWVKIASSHVSCKPT